MTPELVATRGELAALLADARGDRGQVALVPTMGALHEGHASLLRHGRELVPTGALVASVFVNPLQFGAGEDLDRYPRTLDDDLKVCEREGVDVVFAPAVEEVYPGWPAEPQVSVDPGPLADVLEGASRPGHFRGVLTVVAKLFGLVRPDAAIFGEKDYQQLALVRRMVADLCLGVDVVGVETVREPDGLALSSRNRYLASDERHSAVALSRSLRAAQSAAPDGIEAARDAARAVLTTAGGIELDYLALTTADLDEPSEGDIDLRVLVAARVGGTRLIDNLPLTIGQ